MAALRYRISLRAFNSIPHNLSCHSFMALNRASYVPAADWLSQTKEKNCRNFSRVVIRFFPVVEIPIKHSSLYNNYHFADKTIPLEYFDRIL